jgi:DNA damage-binding protein 1
VVRIPELSLLALAFISSSSTDELCLAILHIDHQQRLQLLSRDLDVSPNNEQFSPKPSTLLPPTPLQQKIFPGPFANDTLPVLIHIPAPPSTRFVNAEAQQGGILILGGKRIIYYDLATPSAQLKAKGKSSRTEKKKKEGMKRGDRMEVDNAKEKEEEREWKKRKVAGCVEWPWSEVTAWCKVAGGEEDLGNRFFVGDAFGRLAMVSIDLSQEKKIILLALGEVM